MRSGCLDRLVIVVLIVGAALLGWGKRGSLARGAEQPAATTPAGAQWPAAVQKEVDQMVQVWRERGEPWRLEDLAGPQIPDDQNGAVLIQQAAEELDEEKAGPTSGVDDFPVVPPYPPEWAAQAKENHDTNQMALLLVREARQLGQVSWGSAPRLPLDQWVVSSMPNLNSIRTLANSLADEAMYLHVQGNDRETLAVLADLDFLARAQGKRPFLVPFLVAIGIDVLYTQRLEVLATALNGSGIKQKASDATIRSIIGSLLDDWPITQTQWALTAERIFVLEGARGDAEQFPQGEHVVAVLSAMTRLIDNLDTAFHNPPELPVDDVARIFIKSLARIPEVIQRVVLSRRFAATSLAMALYRADHQGKWPVKLEELVPGYLPSIPVDSFSKTNQALRYEHLADGKRPMLRSVGPDGVVGPVEDAPEKGAFGWQSTQGKSDDQWQDLTAWNGEK